MEGNLPFLLCFTLYLRAISDYKPPRGGLYLEGRFNGGCFASWDVCLEGLIRGGAYFRNLSVCPLFLTKASLKNKWLFIFSLEKQGLNCATLLNS